MDICLWWDKVNDEYYDYCDSKNQDVIYYGLVDEDRADYLLKRGSYQSVESMRSVSGN